MIVTPPNWLLPALLLLVACTTEFRLPVDIQSLRILPATSDTTGDTNNRLKPKDADWVMTLLRSCQWTHPKHVVPEPAYRLEGLSAGGTSILFGIRGTQINVTTPDGAGRCKLKVIDAQRLSKLGQPA